MSCTLALWPVPDWVAAGAIFQTCSKHGEWAVTPLVPAVCRSHLQTHSLSVLLRSAPPTDVARNTTVSGMVDDVMAAREDMTATVRFANVRDSIRAFEALSGADAFDRGQPITPRFEHDRGSGPAPQSVRRRLALLFSPRTHAEPESLRDESRYDARDTCACATACAGVHQRIVGRPNGSQGGDFGSALLCRRDATDATSFSLVFIRGRADACTERGGSAAAAYDYNTCFSSAGHP